MSEKVKIGSLILRALPSCYTMDFMCFTMYIWNLFCQERQPYVAEAEKIDKAYQKALLEEENDKLEVNPMLNTYMPGFCVLTVCVEIETNGSA